MYWTPIAKPTHLDTGIVDNMDYILVKLFRVSIYIFSYYIIDKITKYFNLYIFNI